MNDALKLSSSPEVKELTTCAINEVKSATAESAENNPGMKPTIDLLSDSSDEKSVEENSKESSTNSASAVVKEQENKDSSSIKASAEQVTQAPAILPHNIISSILTAGDSLGFQSPSISSFSIPVNPILTSSLPSPFLASNLFLHSHLHSPVFDNVMRNTLMLNRLGTKICYMCYI